MKKLAATALLVLVLTGCGTTAETIPDEPTEEVSANEEACSSFASNTSRIADIFDEAKGNAQNLWVSLRDDFDRDSLAAEGDVKARLQTLVQELPNVGDVYVYEEARQKTNDLINAVSRACEADGAPISVSTYSG